MQNSGELYNMYALVARRQAAHLESKEMLRALSHQMRYASVTPQHEAGTA